MKYLFFLPVILTLFVACKGDERQALINEMEYREQVFGEQMKKNQPNREDYYLLVETYEDFYKAYPNDSLTPSIQYETAVKWVEMGKFEKASEVLDQAIKDNPTNMNAAEMIFFNGFINEERLGNLAKAKIYYEELIKTFPDHKLAKDAAVLIELINDRTK